MTNAEYHARSEIGKSDLDLLAKSPLLLKMKKDGLYKTEATPNQILGSATHKLVLEPQDFKNEFAVEPNLDKRTKDGKAEFEKFVIENQGKIIIKADEYAKADLIAKSVLEMKATAKFLKDGKAEQSYFSEFDGIKVKCRPDFYNENLGLIVDLKTTSDASPSGFSKSIVNFNYHIQNAFYSDILQSLGKKVNKFLFIAVETKEPFLVGFYELDLAGIEKGREKYKELLNLWKWCVKNENYFGYGDFSDNKFNPVKTLNLPTWKFYE